MEKPTIYADFNNANPRGNLRLNCAATASDLKELRLELREGLGLTLHDEELEADGTAHFSLDEQIWVAAIDWQRVRPWRGASSLRL